MRQRGAVSSVADGREYMFSAKHLSNLITSSDCRGEIVPGRKTNPTAFSFRTHISVFLRDAMFIRTLFIAVAGFFLCYNFLMTAPQSESKPRERLLFNDGWRFRKGDPDAMEEKLDYASLKPWLLPTGNAFTVAPPLSRPEGDEPGRKIAFVQPGYDDSDWRVLTLPHDWGIEGPFEQDLPGESGKLPWSGVAWYRKSFDLPDADCDRGITLEMDGAMAYPAVWCNGHFVGGWPYGYASFCLDLTPYLKPGGKNTLAIRLDNPPESSRWYPGGGIYRNVWLIKTTAVHVEPWGNFVTVPEVTPRFATVNITTRIVNDFSSPAKIRVVTRIFKRSDDGQIEGAALAISNPEEMTVAAGVTGNASARLKLDEPRLWDVDSPRLYTAVTQIRQNGKSVDTVETVFGIRTVQFTAGNGFLLNGKRVPLNGVCNHHDLGALGAAVNVRALERQLEILKTMGCNAIRTSHNPPAPELLDLCDRMGFLVMDEYADCWSRHKKANGYNLLYPDWHERDLSAFIRRDRNHPCIILWSVGNEIPEQGSPVGNAEAAALTEIVHREDPTRPSAVACNAVDAGYSGFQKSVDVFGYNYKPGEYKKFHAANPDVPLFGSETASTISSRGEYFFPVSDDKSGGKSGFQMSSYDLYAPDWATLPHEEFKGQDENPFVAGEFVWTGFDYLGEPTPYSPDRTEPLNWSNSADREKAAVIRMPSRSSYFGIVDLAGFPKDRYYLYQSRWRPDFPMAHILPHWTWPDRVGEVTPVHVYTSGDEAELFLNGKSLGRKKKGKFEYRLRWDDVQYAPGELKVVAYRNGCQWATASVKTAGPAATIRLEPDRKTIHADGRDLSFVTATIADRDGIPVPRSKARLHFAITGPGEIVATDNGDATDHTSFQSTVRNAFNGLALVIVRAKPGAMGRITLRVASEGLAAGEAVLALTR